MSEILGSELTQEQRKLFNSGELTAVVATVDKSGFPNTAPMALFYSPDEKTVLMSIGTIHDTYKNIEENGKVMINVMEDEDFAFSVKGEAAILKSDSDENKGMSVIRVKVEQVKNDQSPVAKVSSGIDLEMRNEKSSEFLTGLQKELENITG